MLENKIITEKQEETKVGYKKTKLGWIPLEWEVIPLEEIGNILNGLTYSPKDLDKNGVLVLRSSNVKKRQIVLTDNVYVNVKKDNFNAVRKGDILICVRNGSKSLIGKNALIDRKVAGVAFGAFMSVYRSKYNYFLYHIFDTDIYKREIHKNLGATINSINSKNLKKIKIPFPPLPEQKKIAQILSTWDKAIDLNQQLIEQLTTRKKGLMQQLLTGKVRLKGFSGVWEEVKMSEIFDEIKRKNDGKGHEPLTISARTGFVSQKKKFDRVIAGGSLDKYIQLSKGDFSYNKGNSKSYKMGCIYLLEDFESGVVPFVYISFKAKISIDSQFYKHWFLNHGLDRQLKAIITSGARGDGLLNVSKSSFFALKVPFPTRKEQTAISMLINATDKEIKARKQYLQTIQTQKKGLMQQLLTGQKRVNLDK